LGGIKQGKEKKWGGKKRISGGGKNDFGRLPTRAGKENGKAEKKKGKR